MTGSSRANIITRKILEEEGSTITELWGTRELELHRLSVEFLQREPRIVISVPVWVGSR